MTSQMHISRDPETGDLRFAGTVSAREFVLLELDAFDTAVLRDCVGAGRSAADWLLGLEIIFRRLQEQRRG